MSETRKLAAILVSDVVGYSRLAGRDEELTLARLRALRSDLIDPIIAVHHGRIVKRTGDGAIVEFRSVVDAVRCAIEAQNGIIERNIGVPPERRIEFRIGIHLGDVMEEGDGDLMGDGVNIAARLEGICQPNGICLSEDAYRQVRSRLDLAVTDLGDQELKNIAEPVRVYSLTVGVPAQAKPVASTTVPKQTRSKLFIPIVSGVAALIVIAAIAAWYFLLRPSANIAANAPAHLSIVVLPFQNLSGDAKQDYLADVLTDELTTYISRIPGSLVIARNTAFTYKGKAVDAKEIGKELGVRYVLEGSVQPTDKRIRTNAQLIDTETGAHLWAEEFDTDKTDLLQTEDEIVTRLARTLQLQLIDVEAAKLRRAHPDNPDAQDLALQCESVIQHEPAGKEAEADFGLCERALALDPNNVLALQLTALKLWARLNYGQSTDRAADFKAADDLIARGLAIDPNNARLYWVKSSMLGLERRFEEASAAAAHSIALDPSDINAYWNECLVEYLLGQPDKVATCIDQALRLSPHDIRLSVLIAFKGNAHFMKQEYDRAIEWFDRSFALNPNDPLNNIYRISALSLAGRDADARTALARYLATAGARSPKTIAAIRKREISDNPLYLAVYDHIFAGLRKAGMPEQ